MVRACLLSFTKWEIRSQHARTSHCCGAISAEMRWECDAGAREQARILMAPFPVKRHLTAHILSDFNQLPASDLNGIVREERRVPLINRSRHSGMDGHHGGLHVGSLSSPWLMEHAAYDNWLVCLAVLRSSLNTTEENILS